VWTLCAYEAKLIARQAEAERHIASLQAVHAAVTSTRR